MPRGGRARQRHGNRRRRSGGTVAHRHDGGREAALKFAATSMSQLTVTGVLGLPEIAAGADLARLISDAAPELRDGDIVVITSKIVSKAEGRVIRADRERAIDREAVRVVARRGQTRIVETRHGLVLAAAGVDSSNTAPGTVVLLPQDPDGSARRPRKALAERRAGGPGSSARGGPRGRGSAAQSGPRGPRPRRTTASGGGSGSGSRGGPGPRCSMTCWPRGPPTCAGTASPRSRSPAGPGAASR